jgi:uncharacterized protein YhaN
MVDVKKHEELFITVMRWVWRNLLASGVIIIAAIFFYNEIQKIDDNISELNDAVNDIVKKDEAEELEQKIRFELSMISPNFSVEPAIALPEDPVFMPEASEVSNQEEYQQLNNQLESLMQQQQDAKGRLHDFSERKSMVEQRR